MDEAEATGRMFDAGGMPKGERWHFYDGEDIIGGAMIRVGKARTGRLLDGVEHNAMTEVPHAR